MAMRRHHDCGNIYRGKLLIIMSWLYSFRGLVHCHHGGKHGRVVLEKELRVVLLDPQAGEGDYVPYWA